MEAQILLWLVITVVAVALLVGSIMISVVLGKYAIHQWFDIVGGPVLTGCGVALIGLTVYGNVSLKAGDFELDLRRLEAALAASENQNRVLSGQIARFVGGMSGALEAVNSTTRYVTQKDGLSNNRELLTKITTAEQKVRSAYDELIPEVASIIEELD